MPSLNNDQSADGAVSKPSNDLLSLVPVTDIAGSMLHYDFPALQIGVAEYREGPTGCTVFYFSEGATMAMDVRGGAAAYMGEYSRVHAICLAGGSVYGLEAATGVSAELLAQRKYSARWLDLALVSGAIVYDFHDRGNTIYPDKALGRAAIQHIRQDIFPLGAHGAGSYVNVGNDLGSRRAERAGQGGAFRQVGETKIAVFTVVNALGAIVDRNGQVVRGHLDTKTGQRVHMADELLQLWSLPEDPPPHQNTTLTVVVTNQKLSQHLLRQLGRQVHSSMARAIQPFHTPFDGDILYAVTTNEVENTALSSMALGAITSELAWDAVLSSIPGDVA